MNTYQRIVNMDGHSEGPSTIPYDPKTLTCQSAATNDSPRDPLSRPVTTCIMSTLSMSLECWYEMIEYIYSTYII